MPVANQFPTRESAYRIAFAGEAPGETEERKGVPFCGASGFLLDQMLAAAGLHRCECFVGNVCQHRPPGNRFDAWEWGDARIQEGIATLLADLRTFKPHLVVTLGNAPLHLFRHGNVPPPRTKSAGYKWPSKVTQWRGSLFLAHETLCAALHCQPQVNVRVSAEAKPSTEPLAGSAPQSPPPAQVPGGLPGTPPGSTPGENGSPPPTPATPSHLLDQLAEGGVAAPFKRGNGGGAGALSASDAPVPPDLNPGARWKCLATLHPAFVLRAWANNFNLRQDLRRAREEGGAPELALDRLEIEWGPAQEPATSPP